MGGEPEERILTQIDALLVMMDWDKCLLSLFWPALQYSHKVSEN